MCLLVLGINHKSATVSLREQVAFSPEQLSNALRELKTLGIVRSAVIISTCNRTEIYYEQDLANENVVSHWLKTFHQIDNDEFFTHLYQYQDEAAAQHLMRVACGLDSLILGEPQILGQVKQAYYTASELNTVEGRLEKLFQKSFTVAKRVRTQTDIGGNAVSVAFAACSLAKQIFESLAKSTVLLIGAGETIELVARHLNEHQCQNLIIANRTLARAARFVEEFDAKAISLEAIPDHLAKADIVISSTASSLPIIGKGMVEKAIKERKHQPMLLIDIAVPRDIESEVAELEDIYLYTVDDLHSIVERNLAQRKNAAEQALIIIQEESAHFMAWQNSLNAVESIKQYRAQSEAVRNLLINKSLQALKQGEPAEQVLIELSNKLMNKLIHAPTQAMQSAAKNSDDNALQTLRKSFGLDKFDKL